MKDRTNIILTFIFTVFMFLAVPLTMTFKIILDQNPKTKWISILLGSDEHAREMAQDPIEE